MAAIYISQTQAGLDDPAAAVRAPNEMSVSLQDIDEGSTGRPASGRMVRSVVRGGASSVRSIELKWENIPIADARTLLTNVGQTFFFIKYLDPYTAAWRSAQFYAGDRKVEIKRITGADGSESAFIKKLSFSCVER